MPNPYKRPNENGKDANVLPNWSRNDRKEKNKDARPKKREKRGKGTGKDLLVSEVLEG